jgi:hypothetical protein
MTAFGIRLERLAADVSWFARATELRLHVILVSPDVRPTALRLVARGARIAERPVPYLLFAQPFAQAGAGWAERIQTLDAAYGTLRAELRKRGTFVTAPPASTMTESSHGAFGARLAQWSASTASALAGAVAILAPEQIDAPARFRDELTTLVKEPRLSVVRWVVVLPPGASLEPLVTRLGAAVLVSDCVAPASEAAADIEKMMVNAGAAGAGASPLARAGMAWPSQPPPARTPAAARSAQPTVDPKDVAREAIRASLFQAAIAMRKEKGLDAVRSLRAGYDASIKGGLVDERLAIHLMLATSVATLGDRKRAIRELEIVQAEGMELERPMTAAQAAGAKAVLQAGARETKAAIATYAEAMAAARMAGEPARPLLIDMLRVAGQLCIDARMEQQGVSYWREAITLAEGQPPGVSGGAIEAGHALAKLCRKHGLIEQAKSLEAQVARLEKPVSTAEVR